MKRAGGREVRLGGKNVNLKTIGLGAAMAGALMATTAQAAIINIDATSTKTVIYTFDPGTYLIQWVGTADGGLYNGWNPSCASGDCASGWRDVFAASTDPSLHPSFTVFGIPGGTYSSALAALAAFQASPTILSTDFDWNGSNYVPTPAGSINQPWLLTVGSSTTVGFFIPEGTKEDNYGGVSLRFTAVPEPTTWAMMILGLGGVGVALRQRRRLATVEVR